MPEALLKRLWDKRVLWFVRMQPTAIAKLHMADLATKYLEVYIDSIAAFCPLTSCLVSNLASPI